MELGRLRCGKGVSRALKKSPSSFWRNRRRIRRWAHGEMEGVPAMPAALGTGPQRQHECVRSGELDEATRSTRILASPISPGTHNRAEVATLLGQHVLVLWRLRRESVSTAGWPRRDPSRLINGRRGRPSAALVQPSITRYSARLKRLPHPASNVRTEIDTAESYGEGVGGPGVSVLRDPTLARIGEAHDSSAAAVALAWTMRSGNVIAIAEPASFLGALSFCGGTFADSLGESEDCVCASDPWICTPNQAAAINAMNKPTRAAPRMLIVQTYLRPAHARA